MGESDQSVVRRVMRHIALPLIGGGIIGWSAAHLVPWAILLPVALVGSFAFTVRELRWIRRQQREMEASRRRLEEFVAYYDRHPRT